MTSGSYIDDLRAEPKVDLFLLVIFQGMDAQQGGAHRLVKIDVLLILFPRKVEAKGNWKQNKNKRQILKNS